MLNKLEPSFPIIKDNKKKDRAGQSKGGGQGRSINPNLIQFFFHPTGYLFEIFWALVRDRRNLYAPEIFSSLHRLKGFSFFFKSYTYCQFYYGNLSISLWNIPSCNQHLWDFLILLPILKKEKRYDSPIWIIHRAGGRSENPNGVGQVKRWA